MKKILLLLISILFIINNVFADDEVDLLSALDKESEQDFVTSEDFQIEEPDSAEIEFADDESDEGTLVVDIASENAVDGNAVVFEAVVTDGQVESAEIPCFDDWQYRGFGYDLPESAESCLMLNDENSDESVFDSIIFEKDCFYVCGRGENADQALHQVKVVLESYSSSEFLMNMNLENYSVTERYWVRINPDYKKMKMPYVAVKKYEKIN